MFTILAELNKALTCSESSSIEMRQTGDIEATGSLSIKKVSAVTMELFALARGPISGLAGMLMALQLPYHKYIPT
jgi:hypothetical protein